MENKKETLTAAEEQKRQQQFIEKARIYVREKSEELGRPLYACTTCLLYTSSLIFWPYLPCLQERQQPSVWQHR